jgi:hypothetical protein
VSAGSGGNLVTTGSQDLILAALHTSFNAGTVVSGSSYTLDTNQIAPSQGSAKFAVEYLLNAAAATYTPNFTWGNNEAWAIWSAAYTASPAGPPPNPPGGPPRILWYQTS